jgi:hypothetical protein
MRPDGSDRRRVTDTPDFNEAGARVSPAGDRLLYYRLPGSEPVDNNTYGTFDLVIADADGSRPEVYGGDFPWASWGPEGRRLARLRPRGVEIVDLARKTVTRRIPRQGIVSQLVWSPDGKWFAGTANGLGPFWSIGRLSLRTGQINAVSETDRYNCTPDWLPDSRRVLYARGIIPREGGRAQLWIAGGDGKERRPLYAESGRHIYGACASPDGRYVLFTRSVEDLGKADSSQTTMAVVRPASRAMIGHQVLGDQSESPEERFPGASGGSRLDLGKGWEPCWTAAEIGE